MIGDFAVIREIGRGGVGNVYLARQVSLNRDIALKILNEEHSQDIAFVQDFINETRVAASLNHPNIVQAYAVNFDSAAGLYYFAMEYIDGESLSALVEKQGKLAPERAAEIMYAVTEALDYAWRERHLVHRDIKPDNIMLTSDGRVKLADMGMAKQVKEEEVATSDIFGTPQYVAPEILICHPADCRSDIYSLGASIYFALTGKFPFANPDLNELAKMHLTTPLPSLAVIAPEVPASLAMLIEIMMAKRPVQRYQNYQELQDDLRRVMDGQMPSHPWDASYSVPIDLNSKDPLAPVPVSAAPPAAEPAAEPAATDSPRKTVMKTGHRPGGLNFGKGANATRPAGGMTTQVAAAPAGKSKTGLVVAIAIVAVLVLVGILAAVFLKGGDKQDAKVATAAGGQSTAQDPVGQLAAVVKKGGTPSPELLREIARKADTVEPGSAEYDKFVTGIAPYLEQALPTLREPKFQAIREQWKSRQAEFAEQKRREEEEARLQAEREKEAQEQAADEKAREQQQQAAAEEAAKQKEFLLDNMLASCQELDFSGAVTPFRTMADTGADEDQAWARQWISCLEEAEELYKFLRNSDKALAGVEIAKYQGTNWTVREISFDTVTLVHVEKGSGKAKPQETVKKADLSDLPVACLEPLVQKALENQGRSEEMDRMFGFFLLTRGGQENRATRLLTNAGETQILEQLPALRRAFVKFYLTKSLPNNKAEAEKQVERLKKAYQDVFSDFEDLAQSTLDGME